MVRLPVMVLILLVAGSGAREANCAEPEPAAGSEGERLYLDEFRPRSQLRVDAHDVRRAKFPCVNMHTHPAALAPEVLRELAASMDEARVAVSISLDGRVDGSFPAHRQMLEENAPGRFVCFVRMDYVGEGREDDPATWDVLQPGFGVRMADKLSEAVRLGAVGLKLLKDLGLTIRDADGRLIAPDDPRFDPVWQRAGELNVPVLWHCADPVAFFDPIDRTNERWEELSRHPDWSFSGEGFPSHEELIDAQMRVIARHPGTTFICAHMANTPENLAKLGADLDSHPNMVVETSARIAELGRQPYTARRFFLKYADRILFGTDGPGTEDKLRPQFRFLETYDEYFPYVADEARFPPQGFWNIYGLGLPDEVLRKVYFENALRIVPGVAARYAARIKAPAE